MVALLARKGKLEQECPADSIRVLDRERLSIRFKDGTEIEQIIECAGRASA